VFTFERFRKLRVGACPPNPAISSDDKEPTSRSQYFGITLLGKRRKVPNSKPQAPEKHQNSSSNNPRSDRDLVLEVSLVLGAWNLELLTAI
jgi:hypothetical protein